MSACRQFRDDLSAHLDGALDPAARAALEAHLGRCPDCTRALEELRATVARIRTLEAVEPPPDLEAKILARVGRPAPGRRRLFLLAARPQVQAAALLLICFTGLLVLKVAGPRKGLVPALQPAPPPPPAEAAPTAETASAPARKKAAPRPEPPGREEAGAGAAAPAPVEAVQAPEDRERTLKREAGAAAQAYPAARSQDQAAKATRDNSFAAPLVAFRLEPSGPGAPEAAVLEALRQCGGILVSRGERSLTARIEGRRLAAFRTSLEKTGRVLGTAPEEPPPLLVVTISW